MINEVITELQKQLESAIAHLADELKKVRTGRASINMVDGLIVRVHDAPMPIIALGSISIPEAQMIQISPYDPSNIQAIANAIREDQTLGLNPVDDGRVIRLQIPPLTTERRQQIVKQLKDKVEECNIRMRNDRHDSIKKLKNLKEDKKIGEDELRRAEKQIDEIMASKKTIIDSMASDKEKDIMTI